jgi:general secretion pathway protein G
MGKGGFMAEPGGSDILETNSQTASSAGRTKTSAAALWSFICGIAGLFIFASIIVLAEFGLFRNHQNVGQIILLCFNVSIILGIILGKIGHTRINQSAGKVKGSGFAITGLVLSVIGIIIFILSLIPVKFSNKLVTSKSSIARIQIAEFEQALEAYTTDNDSLPTNKQGLEELISDEGRGPYLRKALPNDPWGRPYHYCNPGVRNQGSYDLWSNGSDGIEGTEDDIANYK